MLTCFVFAVSLCRLRLIFDPDLVFILLLVFGLVFVLVVVVVFAFVFGLCLIFVHLCLHLWSLSYICTLQFDSAARR
jgi:hypothetical protein